MLSQSGFWFGWALILFALFLLGVLMIRVRRPRP